MAVTTDRGAESSRRGARMETTRTAPAAARPEERHERSGLGITAKIFMSTVGVVVLAIGGAVIWTSIRADALMEKGVRDAFASTQSLFENIEQARFYKHPRLNDLLRRGPTFKAQVH